MEPLKGYQTSESDIVKTVDHQCMSTTAPESHEHLQNFDTSSQRPEQKNRSKDSQASRPRKAKLRESDLETATSTKDASSCLSTSIQPTLAPSPSFDTKGSSKPSIVDSDVKIIRSRKSNPSNQAGASESAPKCAIGNENFQNSTNRRLFASHAMTKLPDLSKTATSSLPKTHRHSPQRRETLSATRPNLLDPNFSNKKQPGAVLPDNSSSIPVPPMSIPSYLQLELSSPGLSPFIINRPSSEFPYEHTSVKFQRLINFVTLPLQLEQVLFFGSIACLDAWLHTFTILPIRFLKATGILARWWGHILSKELRFILKFIYHGTGRMWHRRNENPRLPVQPEIETHDAPPTVLLNPPKSPPQPQLRHAAVVTRGQEVSGKNSKADVERRSRQGWAARYHTKIPQPVPLSSHNKADLIQGTIIILSCAILMKLDASRMYHYIRGQAAIKLYVIFNVLEVGDKLLAALGQDIFECLFSDEASQPTVNGRIRTFRSTWLFVIALIYNVGHAAALFFQVITLNVAVNSYSNALFTLLMSNQFVEIKSTVFKKIEKDNLFQLTCADVVERFQLWLILLIIALRNIVEMGGLSIPNGGGESERDFLQKIFPTWSGEILSPFFLVLGSEMFVDWIKHSYISKFNNVKPAIYGRYLDILAKDYYTNAFVNQNLVKRLGLPVMPLACLFIRSSMQTYHMFLATQVPSAIPSRAATDSAIHSPATTAALQRFDNIIRTALGRSALGVPHPTATNPWYLPSPDDVIAALTMVIFFLGAFFMLLGCKLVLGIILLRFSRHRYRSMKIRESAHYDTDGRRAGVWGMTEVDEDKKRWIYYDEPEYLEKLKDRQKVGKERGASTQDFGKINRYDMLKRIW